MREVMHHGGLKHPFIIDLKASARLTCRLLQPAWQPAGRGRLPALWAPSLPLTAHPTLLGALLLMPVCVCMAAPQSPIRAAVSTVVPTRTRCVCLAPVSLPQEVFLTPEYLAIVMEFAQGGNVS